MATQLPQDRCGRCADARTTDELPPLYIDEDSGFPVLSIGRRVTAAEVADIVAED